MKMSLKVNNVKLHFTCGEFQFLEVDVPEIDTLEKVIELREDIIKKELERKWKCEHLFYETYLAKSGRHYRVCGNCQAQSYEDEKGNFSLWKIPTKRGKKEE